MRFETHQLKVLKWLGFSELKVLRVSTQLTLNTFHLAGVGEKTNVTKGVLRLTELLSNTKNPKQPMCIIYLESKYRYDLDLLLRQEILNPIQLETYLRVKYLLRPINNLDNMLSKIKKLCNLSNIQ